MQVDGSTNFINKCLVVAFISFLNGGEIQENFFLLYLAYPNSKCQDLFNAVSSYVETKGLSKRTMLASMLMAPCIYFKKNKNPNVVIFTAFFTERCFFKNST